MVDMPEEVAEAVRGGGLGLVGGLIYEAISPDLVDGFSDAEYELAKNVLPNVLPLFERREGSIVPEQLQLPQGFTEHYRRDVIPDMGRIRENAALRSATRDDISKVLSSPGELKSLYRPGGITYSGILENRSRGGVTQSDTARGATIENSGANAAENAGGASQSLAPTVQSAENMSEEIVLQRKNAANAAFHRRVRHRQKKGGR